LAHLSAESGSLPAPGISAYIPEGGAYHMNTYDLTVILRNKEAEPLIEKVKEILAKHGTVILGDNSPGVKKLAYQIDKENEGYYLFLNVDVPADSVTKIISEFRLNSNILRYLFVKTQKAATA
jgi:small subunit ribosomal protein S6